MFYARVINLMLSHSKGVDTALFVMSYAAVILGTNHGLNYMKLIKFY